MGAQGIGAAPKQSELVLLGCGRANLVVDASALRKLKEDKEAEEKLKVEREDVRFTARVGDAAPGCQHRAPDHEGAARAHRERLAAVPERHPLPRQCDATCEVRSLLRLRRHFAI